MNYCENWIFLRKIQCWSNNLFIFNIFQGMTEGSAISNNRRLSTTTYFWLSILNHPMRCKFDRSNSRQRCRGSYHLSHIWIPVVQQWKQIERTTKWETLCRNRSTEKKKQQSMRSKMKIFKQWSETKSNQLSECRHHQNASKLRLSQ